MSSLRRHGAGTLCLVLGLGLPNASSAQALPRPPNAGAQGLLNAQRLPPGPVSLSQSTSTNVVIGNSVSCNSGGTHFENSYYRAFTLSEYPQLDSVEFRVDSVVIGVELADDGGGIGQPLTLRLHNSTTNPPTLASLALLSSTDFTIPDQTGTNLILNPAVPPVLINATDILVVEILTPDGTGGGHNFLIGSNPNGQTHPSYIRAAACGLPEIIDLAAIGFPLMHIVMIVSGNNQVPVELQTFEVQ